MSNTNSPLLLTTSEAARLLSVSRSTVHRMVHDGELRRVTIRGCTRIVASSVTATVTPQADSP